MSIQDTRIGELFTPLGDDKLVLVEFSATEAVSELFQFELSAISLEEPGEPLDISPALGQTCSIRIATPHDGDRYFSGTLTEAVRVGDVDGGALYRLELRPWFWLLAHRVNSRAFHQKTVNEIIQTVLDAHGFAEFVNNGDHPNPKLEYCVQHRESDFAFLSRLMEKYGITYYFKFDKNKQTMALSGGRSGYYDAPGGKRNFYADAGHDDVFEEHFRGWAGQRRFNSSKVTLNDYNFKEPGSDLKAEKLGTVKYDPSELEVYKHPQGYDDKSIGDTLAEIAINAIQARDGHSIAEGTCVGLSSGMVVNLANHKDEGEYLVLRSNHHLISEGYRSGSGEAGQSYSGQYELFPTERPYASPQVTPRPVISGPQTGVVTTMPGDDPDNYGRVKVKFHWGRDDPDGISMWCRVAQVWAGDEWGGQFIPRVDMEALVQFIDGDPDRPIVIGTVHNERNPYPFEIKDTSGWRTEGLSGGFNELAFVDRGGSELIRIIGEKDLTATLKNNVFIEAGNEIKLQVGDSTIVIDQQSITLKSKKITIEAGLELKTNSGATASHEAGAPMIIKAPLVKIN